MYTVLTRHRDSLTRQSQCSGVVAFLSRTRMFIFTKRFPVTPTRNHDHHQLVFITPTDGRVKLKGTSRCEISRSPSYRACWRRRRSMLVRSSLGRSGLIAGAAQSVGTCDLVPKKRVVSLRTGCCSSPKSSGFRGRRMRSGISGYQTPSSGRRVTRVVREAA